HEPDAATRRDPRSRKSPRLLRDRPRTITHALPVSTDSEPLVELRDRAERQLNAVRAVILGLLAISAVAYSPTLTESLRLVNISVLIPTLAWTLFQYLRWYHRPRLPAWLSIANPVVDVTAVTLSMLGYGIAQSAGLALKAPIFLAYFAILAARPVTSSTRIA